MAHVLAAPHAVAVAWVLRDRQASARWREQIDATIASIRIDPHAGRGGVPVSRRPPAEEPTEP